jgi:hypothetical protein
MRGGERIIQPRSNISQWEAIMTTKFTLFTISLGLVALPFVAFADVSSVKDTRTGFAGEISIATDHAGYALASRNLDGVHMHLHHVINCLEGPNGANFDRVVENPCSRAGKGAIVDAADPSVRSKLQSIDATVQTGLSAGDEATARKVASDVQTALRAVK